MRTRFYTAVVVLGILECASLNEPGVLRTTVCSGHNLSAQCDKNRHLVISSVVAGLKGHNACNKSIPSRRNCCKLDEKQDCVEAVNDTKLYHACTGRTQCNRAPTVNKTISCRNSSFPSVFPSFYSMKYMCIANSRFGDCSSSVLESCSNGQTLYLTSPGYPSHVPSSTNCECSISSDCDENIHVRAVDIKISKREYMFYNDSFSSLYDTDRDNKYIISDQYVSKAKTILFKANMVNGRFLVAIEAGCTLTIRCPREHQRKASYCDNASNNDFPLWWIAIVIVIVLCIGFILAFRVYKKKKDSKSPSSTFSKVKNDCISGTSTTDKTSYINDHRSLFESLGEGTFKNVPPLIGTINMGMQRLPPISHEGPSVKEEGNTTQRQKNKDRKKKQRVNPSVESVEKKKGKSEMEETLDFFTSDIIDMTNNSNSIPGNLSKE